MIAEVGAIHQPAWGGGTPVVGGEVERSGERFCPRPADPSFRAHHSSVYVRPARSERESVNREQAPVPGACLPSSCEREPI